MWITWPPLTNINNHKLKLELIISSLKICPPILQVPFMIYCEGAVRTVLQSSHPHLLRFINILPCISPINHRNDSHGNDTGYRLPGTIKPFNSEQPSFNLVSVWGFQNILQTFPLRFFLSILITGQEADSLTCTSLPWHTANHPLLILCKVDEQSVLQTSF